MVPIKSGLNWAKKFLFVFLTLSFSGAEQPEIIVIGPDGQQQQNVNLEQVSSRGGGLKSSFLFGGRKEASKKDANTPTIIMVPGFSNSHPEYNGYGFHGGGGGGFNFGDKYGESFATPMYSFPGGLANGAGGLGTMGAETTLEAYAGKKFGRPISFCN